MAQKVSKAKHVKLVAATFNPKSVTKRLLGALSTRAKDVIIKRYGLGEKTKRMTLEAIGQEYGITRERVRQIENYALSTVRKADVYKKEGVVFEQLKEEMLFFGGIVSEEHFLDHLAKDASPRNHFHFLMVVGETFEKRKEDEHFEHRWHADEDVAEKVEDALKRMYEKLSDEELLSESEIVSMFLDHVKDLSEKYRDEEMVKRWLLISKRIGSNDLGEWGPSESPAITPKGIRDYAYLAIRNHGSPLHFTEVAKRIAELFDKKAHVATTHNELIKDKRFVLVGRGLYALVDWGYSQGVVRDVIKDVLKEHGALSKDEVIEKVLKERYVKPNTILVNLQDSKHFSKKNDGTYTLN